MSHVFFKLLALTLALTPFLNSHAQDPKDPNRVVSPEEIRLATEKASEWLLKHQHSQMGFFSHRDLQREWKPEERFHPSENSAAMTALAIMGLSSIGHMPGDPTPQGRAMAKALDYVLRDEVVNEEGYLGRFDGSRMYGHGIITLMLSEMVGHGATPEQDAKIKERLEKAIELTLRSQRVEKGPTHRGGWRYEPDSRDSDLSVTVWHLLSLRAAKNAGFEIPKESIDLAVEYVKRCWRGNRQDRREGETDTQPFQYMVEGGSAQFSTTSAGMLSLQISGDYEAKEVLGAGNYLLQNPPKPTEQWFFYGMYYYAQAMYQLGIKEGVDFGDTARNHSARTLLSLQTPDGNWQAQHSEHSAGPIYATSLALLSLSVQFNYLPIYQK